MSKQNPLDQESVKEALKKCQWELFAINSFGQFTTGAIKRIRAGRNKALLMSGDGVQFYCPQEIVKIRKGLDTDTVRAMAIVLAAGAYERYLQTIIFHKGYCTPSTAGKPNHIGRIKKHEPSATQCLDILRDKLILQDDDEHKFVYFLCDYRHITVHCNSKINGIPLEVPVGHLFECIKFLYKYSILVYQKAYSTDEIIEHKIAKKCFSGSSRTEVPSRKRNPSTRNRKPYSKEDKGQIRFSFDQDGIVSNNG